MVKRKKHDKDKYYNLARQQGYRARSAFKLIQLNKKYDFLSTSKVCVDLCAAPGGWCQVAAKFMPASSIIIGMDLLPIRPIRNVKTFVCDITSQKCRQILKQELQTWKADVVLCDGAPNVGAEYSKDAYVQNELALIAMKLAVEILGPDGTFVTKVFRSRDYNALLWVFTQLFKNVSATKPLSSRNESAEIFVVCEHFLAPHSIDPRLLDPKHVFAQVDAPEKGLTIFHPKHGQQKRHRDGYDESLGITLRNSISASEFIKSDDPIRILSDATEIHFLGEENLVFKENKLTTVDICECLKDLKVLGKGDFRTILKWRTKMQDYAKYLLESVSEDKDEITVESKTQKVEEIDDEEKEEKDEEKIREEILQIRLELAAKKKREKKKEREKQSKQRLRIAMGMENNAMELPQDDQAFSLRNLGISKENLDQVISVDSNDIVISDEETNTRNYEDKEMLMVDGEEYNQILEEQMENMYEQYLSKKGDHQKTAKAVKRSKIAKRALAGEALAQDASTFDGGFDQYAKVLKGEDEDSSENEYSSEDIENPLVIKAPIDEEMPKAVVSRWFSNPLFADLEENKVIDNNIDSEDDQEPLEMPLTEKVKRKIKRKARRDRKDAKLAKINAKDAEFISEDLEIVSEDKFEMPVIQNQEDEDLSPAALKKRKLIREGMGIVLSETPINSGFEVVPASKSIDEGETESAVDIRKYDSDNEDYDSEDYAKTLALGTIMLKPSKKKDMMDASYNRFAWNDPQDLPDWFQDDEERHHRPQLEIPKALLQQMKDKFMAMATKPVKKVAEARARKKRQNLRKSKAAKKKATEIANMPDMPTREKLKAIEKAMKGAKEKKSNKVYVVSRRGGRSSTAQNDKGKKGRVKLVDPRLKKDKRNATLKAKRGKK